MTILPCVLILAGAALAGPLEQAEIHKIVNDVRVVDTRQGSARMATVRDVIKGDLAIRTGVESRAELLFQDNTLTRLGAGALFSFQPGTRNLTLDRGTMLLQVPKGLGGARIRAAAVTAAITGTTVMLENIPGGHVKVLVLEGRMKLSLNGQFGQSVVLTPGRMLIIGAKDRQLPKPVTVSIEKIVKTSALVDPVKFSGSKKRASEPLPSMDLIQSEIARQSVDQAQGRLVATNSVIKGAGAQPSLMGAGDMTNGGGASKNRLPASASGTEARIDVAKSENSGGGDIGPTIVLGTTSGSGSSGVVSSSGSVSGSVSGSSGSGGSGTGGSGSNSSGSGTSGSNSSGGGTSGSNSNGSGTSGSGNSGSGSLLGAVKKVATGTVKRASALKL